MRSDGDGAAVPPTTMRSPDSAVVEIAVGSAVVAVLSILLVVGIVYWLRRRRRRRLLLSAGAFGADVAMSAPSDRVRFAAAPPRGDQHGGRPSIDDATLDGNATTRSSGRPFPPSMAVAEPRREASCAPPLPRRDVESSAHHRHYVTHPFQCSSRPRAVSGRRMWR